jgi:hypothetical protein
MRLQTRICTPLSPGERSTLSNISPSADEWENTLLGVLCKKNCCQTSTATAQSAMLTLRTVSTRIWSERKTSAWRHCRPTWYARPRGYKDGMWQVGLQSANTRRRNERRPRCKDSCSISQILPRVCTTHLLNSTSSPDFTPHLSDTFVELTCRTRFQPLSKIRTPLRRIWRTVCRTPLAQHRKTLLNNTSAKSLRRLSLRLGSVNKFPTLYG